MSYVVKPGDSLWKIAVQHNTTVAALVEANNIANPSLIQPGQVLVLAKTKTYTVKPGDTVWAIAQAYGVSVEAIANANRLANPNLINVGQVLVVPGLSTPAQAPAQAPAPPAQAPAPPAAVATAGLGSLLSRQDYDRAVGAMGFSVQHPLFDYANLVAGARFWPQFASGPRDVGLREVAALLAHIAQETAYRYAEEIVPTAPPYYGRGPIQLTHDYNYRAASQALFGDERLVQNPDSLLSSPDIAWGATLWYWHTRNPPTCHDCMQPGGGGFGGTIRSINGIECGGGNARAQQRASYFRAACGALGVDPGPAAPFDC